MEPDTAICGDLVDIVESPNTEDLEAGLFKMAHDHVHVGVTLEERDPIRVTAGKVVCVTVDDESKTITARDCSLLVGI